MAYQQTTHHDDTGFMDSVQKRIMGFGHALLRGFDAYARARSRMDEIERMNAKSDEDLAAMGLQRQDIPRYVFRDMLHY